VRSKAFFGPGKGSLSYGVTRGVYRKTPFEAGGEQTGSARRKPTERISGKRKEGPACLPGGGQEVSITGWKKGTGKTTALSIEGSGGKNYR